MEAYQERVVLEKKELDEKINKLSVFVSSDTLKEDVANVLKKQLAIMIDYSNILSERISNF